LEERERVEALERLGECVREGFTMNHAVTGDKSLEAEQQVYRRALAVDLDALDPGAPGSTPRKTGALTDEELARAQSILRCMATAGAFTTGH
jgi:hypothetical protein